MTMRSETSGKPRLAVLVSPVKYDRYGESTGWDLEIVKIDPSDQKPRNCSRDSVVDRDGTEMFEDFKLRTHISWYGGKWNEPTWGEFEYRNVYSLDMRSIDVLSAGLKKCAKVEKTFPIRPVTFAQYVILMAKGLGVTHCVKRQDCTRDTGCYTDSGWSVRTIDSVTSMIEYELDKFRATVCPKEVAA
jgi:hypothetical protein